MTAGPRDGVLSHDQLTRASTLIGAFKGQHLLFADGMADRWPRLSNCAAMFDCKTPMAAMIDRVVPIMPKTRQYVDALSGVID
jgi:hypothetical protein